MTKINFRPGKLAFGAMASGLAAALMGWSWSGDGSWLMGLGAIGSGCLAGAMARCALGDRPALLFDESGITINTLYRGRTLRWDEVRDIVIERTTVRYMFIITVAKKEFVSIRTKGGALSGANYKLSASLIELPAGGVMELHSRLCAAMAAAGSSPAAQATYAPASDTGSGFDPDAAIARYLAAKQAEPAPAPSPSPGPARPVFGRRAV